MYTKHTSICTFIKLQSNVKTLKMKNGNRHLMERRYYREQEQNGRRKKKKNKIDIMAWDRGMGEREA